MLRCFTNRVSQRDEELEEGGSDKVTGGEILAGDGWIFFRVGAAGRGWATEGIAGGGV